MGFEDFAESGDSDFDSDEDLFELSPSEDTSAEASDAAQAAADGATRSDNSPLESLAAPLPSQTRTASSSGTELLGGADQNLDEDLFGFPPIELPDTRNAPEIAPFRRNARRVKPSPSEVKDLLEDDFDDIIREAQEEHRREIEDNDEIESATDTHAQEQSEDYDELPVAQRVLRTYAQVPAPATTVAAAPSKALWVLTAGILVFMFGLLGIAWRATSTFQSQLEQVRSNVVATNQEVQRTVTDRSAQIAQLEAELASSRAAAESAAAKTQVVAPPPQVKSATDVALVVANEYVSTGRFSEARRVLFDVLAHADRLPDDRRELIEQETRFLIAQSYVTEAMSLAGEPE